MKDIKFYCVTNKEIDFINDKNFYFGWVGHGNPPHSYLKCDDGYNIYYKEKYYSELTFHYWFWKNLLKYENDDTWIGFCQKRRYWINDSAPEKINKFNINKYLLKKIEDSQNIDSILCQPINTHGIKKMKLLKRGWKNLIRNPLIFFNKNYQNIKVQFDMHHGFGNLIKAINLLDQEDRKEFLNFVKTENKFNPHIMFISKKKIINEWFKTLFAWLQKCEVEFGFKDLTGYDKTRLYAYLAERFLSFWFRKYTNYREQAWTFIDV